MWGQKIERVPTSSPLLSPFLIYVSSTVKNFPLGPPKNVFPASDGPLKDNIGISYLRSFLDKFLPFLMPLYTFKHYRIKISIILMKFKKNANFNSFLQITQKLQGLTKKS